MYGLRIHLSYKSKFWRILFQETREKSIMNTQEPRNHRCNPGVHKPKRTSVKVAETHTDGARDQAFRTVVSKKLTPHSRKINYLYHKG